MYMYGHYISSETTEKRYRSHRVKKEKEAERDRRGDICHVVIINGKDLIAYL